MLRPYRAILARPGATAFSSAGVVARLPIAMVGIGIILMVQGVYDSYAMAGRISAVYILTHALCAPQLAKLVDRFGQARVMRPAVTVATAGMAGLIAVGTVEGHPAWLYTFSVVAGSGVGSIGALVRARWTYVLDNPREVHTAFSLESALDELCFVVGPALATVLATAVMPTAGLIVPALACTIGGYALLAQRATEPPTHVRERGQREPSLLRSAAMLVLIGVSVGIGAILGAIDVSVVAFAEEQGNKGAAGLLLAVFAAASLVAGLGYGTRHWMSALWKRFAIGTVALAAGVSLLFFVTSIPALIAVMAVTGLTIAPTMINCNALVEQSVRPRRLTEGLTWVATALGVGVAAGASLAGAMIDERGSHGGFLVVIWAGGFAVVATVASLHTLRSVATTTGSITRRYDDPPEARPAT